MTQTSTVASPTSAPSASDRPPVSESHRSLPQLIQGGMGVAVSNWLLARKVSQLGHLGVVSGTAIETVMIRRLQDGDPGGHIRRAMAKFPLLSVVDFVLTTYFREQGRAPGEPYALLPLYRQRVSPRRDQITMLGAFVEVTLAKEGHSGIVGINLLTKIQMPTLATLYGAMLANVDVVLMGTGIPRDIPGALDALSQHQPASLVLHVVGQSATDVTLLDFDPRVHLDVGDGSVPSTLTRPQFLPIVAAASLAQTLARKSNGRVDGFVVEGHTAGGHNAPPRGALRLDDAGEPIYGERDHVDLQIMRDLGLPFWIAGGAGSPAALADALARGAAGIQVGTLFAFSDESGFTRDIKRDVVRASLSRSLQIRTDVRASPTGYPFKRVSSTLPNTILPSRSPARARICDLGALREVVRTGDGTLIYRCPAEPVAQYVAKGGAEADTIGRECLCNALCASAGLPQVRDGDAREPVLVTSGDDILQLDQFVDGREHYTAADVVAYITGQSAAQN